MPSAKGDRLQVILQIVEDHIADTGRLPSTPDIIQAVGQPENQVRKDLALLQKGGRLVTAYEAPKNPTIYMPRHMYDALIREQKVPEWMSEFMLSRASEIRENIHAQQVELTELHRIEALLYAAGRSLEEAVEASMQKLEFAGLQLTYEDADRWDLSFEHGGRVHLCDVKGKSKWIRKRDVAQLSQWLQKYVDENPNVDPGKIQGLLIVNHFRDLPPSDRWPNKPANAPISHAGERYLRVAKLKYLTTVDLFHAAKAVLDGKTNSQRARQQVMSKVRSNTEVD